MGTTIMGLCRVFLVKGDRVQRTEGRPLKFSVLVSFSGTGAGASKASLAVAVTEGHVFYHIEKYGSCYFPPSPRTIPSHGEIVKL